MIRRCGDDVEALAFRLGFALTPETTRRFPELCSSEAIYGELRDGKRAVNIDRVFPGRHEPRCRPEVIVFPKISEQPRSELARLTGADTLARLMEQSPGIMVDKPLVSKQLEALSLLTDQAKSYQILVGTDIYEQPEAVCELLMEAK